MTSVTRLSMWRSRIPILLVDNAAAEHGKKGSESFYIYKIFSDTLKGFEVKFATAAQLDKMNLQPFSSVMMCNIPKLEEAARKNLEEYVANGGAWPSSSGRTITENDVKFYNDVLYRSVPLSKITTQAHANRHVEGRRTGTRAGQAADLLEGQRVSFRG